MIPAHLKGGVDRYVNERIPPGHFLTAVLENNLREAFSRADDVSRYHMADIVSYLYNEIPARAWGTPERVQAWLDEEPAGVEDAFASQFDDAGSTI